MCLFIIMAAGNSPVTRCTAVEELVIAKIINLNFILKLYGKPQKEVIILVALTPQA